MSRKQFCLSVTPGFYLLPNDRCYYLTGTLGGNKWIDFDWADEGWSSLMWTCINKECIEDAIYSEENPIDINF